MEIEEQLLERLQAGDEEALSMFVDAYQQRIYYLALRWLRDPDDASDITQKAFLRALQAIRNFRGQARLNTWLYQITINLCKNHFRDNERARRKVENYTKYRDLREQEKSSNTASEDFASIRGYVDQLPERQRETILLRVVEDLSFKEISEAMRCSEGTVKSNYHHAVKNLRAMVLPEKELNG